MAASSDIAARRGGKTRGSPDPGSRWDKIFFAGFILALLLLAFIGGAIVTAADVFPGAQLAHAYNGGKALYDQLTHYDDIYKSDLWARERTTARGVTIDNAAKTQKGATLYSSGHEAAAFLVAMDGTVLHEWRRPYSTVWNKDSGIAHPQPDSHVYFRKVQAFDNGDLLAIYEGVDDTLYGYGMVKLDRNSQVLWTYFGRTHHDFDVGPDGRIYVLTHEIVSTPLKGFGNLRPPRVDDFLAVLSPDGKELAKIPLLQAVAKSRYSQLLHTVSSYATGDPLHANDVDFIDAKTAKNFAYGKAGQVLLSFRELNAIAVLDIPSQQIVWATRGPWLGQHDPDILPNGDIVLFDNYGNYQSPAGISRVIEFDPRTMNIDWRYIGDADHPLDSMIRSSQQRLANGNTLIADSQNGRILEVTPKGEIAWEFVNPVRGGEGNKMIPIVAWAERISPDAILLSHLASQ